MYSDQHIYQYSVSYTLKWWYSTLLIHLDQSLLYTGLPTKDETSETTVRKLNCMFPHIHDALQLWDCVFLCQIILSAISWLYPNQETSFIFGFLISLKFKIVFIVSSFVFDPVVFQYRTLYWNICQPLYYIIISGNYLYWYIRRPR